MLVVTHGVCILGKFINRVKNPKRSEPVESGIVKEKFAKVFEEIPGLSLEGENAPLNVVGTLIKSPKIAELFVPFWGKSKHELNLSIREQELIILKTACFFGCDYVWGHHVPIAKQADVTDEEIAQVPLPVKDQNLPLKDKVLIKMVESVLKKANLSDEEFEEIVKHFDEAQILDIIMVISHYLVFNSVNNIFGVELEHSKLPALPDM